MHDDADGQFDCLLQELQEARQQGIRTLAEADDFELERRKKAGQEAGGAAAALSGLLQAPLAATAPSGESLKLPSHACAFGLSSTCSTAHRAACPGDGGRNSQPGGTCTARHRLLQDIQGIDL